MALIITDDCTNCDACIPVCPNQAITEGEIIFEIDHERCTECVGHEEDSQCVLVCPADCIIEDPDHVETREQLQAKFEAIMG